MPSGILTDTTSWLSPSGDATGATDIAAINAALAAKQVVELRGPGFIINAPIVQPSNTTLVLRNATVRLADHSNCNLWQNANRDLAGNRNVSIVGIGRAYFDGNASGQDRQTGYALLNNVGIAPVMVDNLQIRDIQLGPTNIWGIFLQGVTNSHIANVRMVQDNSTTYQDGIDVGLGCRNVKITGTRGVTEDDIHAVFAMQYQSSYFGPIPLHALYQPGSVLSSSPGALAISNIHYEDTQVDGPYNLLRIFNDDTATVSGIVGRNLRNLRPGSQAGFSTASPHLYIDPTHLPAVGSVSGVSIDGLICAPNNDVAVGLNSHIDGLEISNLDLLKDSWQGIIGTSAVGGQGHASDTPTIRYCVFDGIKAAASASYATNDIMAFHSGAVVQDITVRNVAVRECHSILNNACAVTGLHLRNVHVGLCDAIPFNSSTAETGDFNDVIIDALAGGVTKTYGTAIAARMGTLMPRFEAADTTPVAVGGSYAWSAAGKVLDGGSAVQAFYVSDGAVWGRISPVNIPAQVSSGAVSGKWYIPPATAIPDAVGAPSYTRMFAVPVLLRAGTLTKLGAWHWGSPTAGETFRMGVYADNGNNYPGALLFDAGTIDMSTAAGVLKAITFSQAIPSTGLYWLVGVKQGAGSVATMRCYGTDSIGLSVVSMPTDSGIGTGLDSRLGFFYQSGVSGALPANFTGTVNGAGLGGGGCPVIGYQY